MNRMNRLACLFVISLLATSIHAQQGSASAEATVVPRLVNFSGKATDAQGKVISGIAGATFGIYKDQYGGAPLWLETQNVQSDAKGNFTVQLGATKPDGLPLDLFSSGEARWLGVTINGGSEQLRVLLLSVPYALKAADAETLGGKPLSAFQLLPLSNTANKASAQTAPPATEQPNEIVCTSTTACKTGFLPLFTSTGGSAKVGGSALFQSGSNLGIGTTTPAAGLDVNGKGDVRDTLTLFPKGTDSTLVINGTSFKIDQTGKVTFTSAQTFPGTGTVTSVGLSAPSSDFIVTGSPVTTSGTLGLNWNVAPTSSNTANAIVKRDATGSFSANTITATGQLTAGSETINGNFTATGLVTAGSLTGNGLGGYGVYGNGNTDGVYGTSSSGNGVYGITGDSTGVSAGVYGTGGAYGVAGIGTGSNSYGVYASGVSGGVLAQGNFPIVAQAQASSGQAVLGVANSDSDYGPAIYGIEWGATKKTLGLEGFSASPNGMGVLGVDVLNSYTSALITAATGVWGDTNQTNGVGVRGTADGGLAVSGLNNGSNPTAFFDNLENANGAYLVFETYADYFGGGCAIDVSGNLSCTGSITPVVPVSGNRKVALYAIEGPENWFEDAGSAQLVNGEAVVDLEAVFGETVNTDMNYHVFLTPNGDCRGLYVAQKTGNSFIVRELGGGTSSIAFDYRIMAKRRGYESIRLADKTETFNPKNLPVHRSQIPSKPPDPAELRKRIEALIPARPVAHTAVPGVNRH